MLLQARQELQSLEQRLQGSLSLILRHQPGADESPSHPSQEDRVEELLCPRDTSQAKAVQLYHEMCVKRAASRLQLAAKAQAWHGLVLELMREEVESLQMLLSIVVHTCFLQFILVAIWLAEGQGFCQTRPARDIAH